MVIAHADKWSLPTLEFLGGVLYKLIQLCAKMWIIIRNRIYYSILVIILNNKMIITHPTVNTITNYVNNFKLITFKGLLIIPRRHNLDILIRSEFVFGSIYYTSTV